MDILKALCPFDRILMIAIFVLVVLLAWVIICYDDAHAGYDFEITGENLFATHTGTDASLAIPRWKGYISTLDSNVWNILLTDSIYRSTDAGATFASRILLNPQSYGYHSSLAGAGDSIVISSSNKMWIISGTTQRTAITIPNHSSLYSYCNTVIDTAGTDAIFILNRWSQ